MALAQVINFVKSLKVFDNIKKSFYLRKSSSEKFYRNFRFEERLKNN